MKRFAAIAVVAAFVVGTAAAQQPVGKRFAVLVGVGEYDHPNLKPLAYAESDATELGQVLRERGYVVELMTTQSQQPALKPTLANIRARLGASLAKCRKGDIVLLGLAGHGLKFEGDKDSYFCPTGAKPFLQQKATLLSIKQLYDELDQSNAGVKLMLVDACRDDPTSTRGASGDGAPRPPRGVAALFSCAVGQRAYELDRYKHGIFFYHVIQGLKGAARDDDNDVTWYSLSNYVRKRVNRDVQALVGRGARQEPHGIDELIGEPPVLVSLASKPPLVVERPPNPVGTPSLPRAPVRRVPAEQCLPDDTKLVAYVNVHQMARSPVLRPAVLEITNSLAADGQKNAELDLVKDTRIYYFAFNDFTGQHVGILQGSYLPETFQQAFAANPLFEPASLPGVAAAFRQKETKFAVALLDRDAIAYAFNEAALQNVAAKRAGERTARYAPALRAVMGSINRDMSMTFGFADRSMWTTDAAEKQVKGIRRVGAFRLSAYFGEAIYINGGAGLSNPTDAAAFAATLRAERAKGEVELAKPVTPDAALVKALLKTVRVETAGPTKSGVSVKSVLSAEEARPLIDEFIKGFREGFKGAQDKAKARAKP